MQFNTRIAPSPTGYFHLGTARTAYFNWLAARASGGRFLLRIDDTDQARNNPACVDIIYQAMGYLGLDYDDSFFQSQRTARYRQVADDLLRQGRAVLRDGACFLQHALPTDFTGFVDGAVGTVRATQADHDAIANLVLIRSDGNPTYHFANVVDDLDYNINFVLRGADHISNTVRQIALYDALGHTPPRYAHVGLLHDWRSGKKISKSANAPSLLDYRDQGIDSDAMCNFLLRLGWGPQKDDKSTAMLSRDAALQLFLSAGNLRGAASKVDFDKLASFDRKYKSMKRTAAA